MAKAPKANLEQVADHIVRLVETAGIDHVGIGSDYFGGASPVGLEDVSRFPHLFAELVRRGFSERDLEKMSSENMLRVLRRVETVGEVAAQDPPAGDRPARGLSRRVSGVDGVRGRNVDAALVDADPRWRACARGERISQGAGA